MSGSVIRLKPFYYIHVLDNNANVTTVETGPQTFTVMDHQTVVQKETPMIIIPPRHYCIISNPVHRVDGNISFDKHGQAKLKHGDEEIRFEQEPFPLYPGEQLYGKVAPLQVVAPLTALKLRATRDFHDEKEVKYHAGDEWLFPGPGTYTPRVEVTVVEVVRATVVGPNQALRIRAKKEFSNPKTKKQYQTGEEWIVREEGAYIPNVNEEIVQTVNAVILTEKKALHLRASRTFTDAYPIVSKAG